MRWEICEILSVYKKMSLCHEIFSVAATRLELSSAKPKNGNWPPGLDVSTRVNGGRLRATWISKPAQHEKAHSKQTKKKRE